jgi:hypothetical protein
LTDGRSCLIGQIPAKSFLPQVSSRDIVAGLFSKHADRWVPPNENFDPSYN